MEEKKRMTVLKWLLALVIIGLELWILIMDVPIFFRDQRNTLTGKPVAVLSESDRAVRVQDYQDLLWNDATEGQGLYLGQSILTLDNSAAEVEFENGSGIRIAENSLVQIQVQKKNALTSIEFVRGSIEKRATKTDSPELFVIKSDDADLVFNSSSEFVISAPKDGQGPAQIQVKKGSISLQKENSTVEASEGEVLKVPRNFKDTKEIVKTKIELIPILPQNGIRISSTKIHFQWKMTNAELKDEPKKVEISSFSSFSKITKAFRTEKNSVEVELQSPNKSATLYWRVKGLKSGKVSPTSQFVFSPPRHFSLIYPPNDLIAAPGITLDFVWQPVELAKEYELKLISDLKEFKFHTDNNRYTVKNLEAGRYEWSVTAIRENSVSELKSETWKFFLQKSEPPPPPPPPKNLSRPKFKESARLEQSKPFISQFLSLLIPSVQAAEKGKWEIVLSWDSVKGIEKYKVQVARTRSFSVILADDVTSKTSWTWNYQPGLENSKGRVFYRVASISSSGQVGEFSDPVPIEIPEKILRKARSEERKGKETKETRLQELALKQDNFDWILSLNTGLSSFSQTSGAGNFESVQSDGYYFDQGLSFLAVWLESKRRTSLGLDFLIAKFGTPTDFPDIAQSNRYPVTLSLKGYRSALWTGDLYFDFGGSVDWSHDWIKIGAQSLQDKGRFSMGPLLGLTGKINPKTPAPWIPSHYGIELKLPFIGIFFQSYAAIQPRIWTEWKVYSKFNAELALSSETSFWKFPENTQLSRFTVWLNIKARM